MLAFLEPEVDFCWTAVIAPPDSQSSHLLGLAWEPRVWGMWNDTVFPPHSSPLLSGYAGSSSESLSRSSNVPPGLERLYGDGFFLPFLDSSSLQLRNISPPLVPLTVTTSGLSSSPVNYIPVNRADLMATAATNSAMLNSTPSQSNTMALSRKRRIIIDPDGKKAIAVKETNRKKITNLERLHLPLSADPSSGHKQPMKAPMKRSQKLGDKITALQQLVSPFGKTDTASVLDEATIYIKSLHEHIRVLTAPYFQSRSLPYQQDVGEVSASLHEMGLCVAPISSPIVEIASRASYEHRAANRKPWSFGGALS